MKRIILNILLWCYNVKQHEQTANFKPLVIEVLSKAGYVKHKDYYIKDFVCVSVDKQISIWVDGYSNSFSCNINELSTFLIALRYYERINL